MTSLILDNVRPWGDATASVAILNGRFVALADAPADSQRIDGKGAILLPGLWKSAHPSRQDHVRHALASEHRRLDAQGEDRQRARVEDPSRHRSGRQSARQVALSVAAGSTHIRSHVDVDTVHGLKGVEGVMARATSIAT